MVIGNIETGEGRGLLTGGVIDVAMADQLRSCPLSVYVLWNRSPSSRERFALARP